jgi:hypothetical protein
MMAEYQACANEVVRSGRAEPVRMVSRAVRSLDLAWGFLRTPFSAARHRSRSRRDLNMLLAHCHGFPWSQAVLTGPVLEPGADAPRPA